MTKDNKISFKGKSIYLGIDNHKNSVTVYFICENINHGCHTFKPSGKEIGRYLRRNFPDGNYYSAYEAGYCGYKLHEELQSEGIKNLVINPSDVPTNDKEKKRKNDAMDSYKIARGLKWRPEGNIHTKPDASGRQIIGKAAVTIGERSNTL